MKASLIIIISLLVSCRLLTGQIPDSLKYESVQPEDFLTLIRFKENILLIDVREPFEFRKERIENAINMPNSKNFEKLTNKIDKEANLLLYCTSGVRSRWAALKLYDLGFRKLYSLDGGITKWKRIGLPVVRKRLKVY
jgi:rhodanese-related sulfurtransferase